MEATEAQRLRRATMTDKERDELIAVVAELQQTNARLSDLLRWRDTRVEQPTADGEYMTASSKRGTCQCIQRYANSEWDFRVNFWRPIGPLPGGE